MRKPLGIQKCDGPTYRPTQQGVESRVRDSKEVKRTGMKRPRGKKRPRKRKGKAKRRKVNEREPGMRFRHFTTESSRRKVRQIQSPIKKVYEHQERPTLNYTFFFSFYENLL